MAMRTLKSRGKVASFQRQGAPGAGHIFATDVGERLPVGVADDEASVRFPRTDEKTPETVIPCRARRCVQILSFGLRLPFTRQPLRLSYLCWGHQGGDGVAGLDRTSKVPL